MGKYILFFLTLVIGGSIYLAFVEEVPDAGFVSLPKNTFHKTDFVSMDKKNFMLQGKSFYPLAVNYIGALQTDGNDYWPRPSLDYVVDSAKRDLNKEECLKE